MFPKVSIVTICYNAESNIGKTLDSMVMLKYTNFEVIIVDGGSKDGTLDLVNQYMSLLPIKIVSEPDNGIYDAMNKGINLSSGEWVIFMNAGDRFYTQDVLTDIFSKDLEDYEVIAGQYYLEKEECICAPCSDINDVKFGHIITCHQAMFFNKPKLQRDIYYDLRYKVSADNELMMRLVRNKYKINVVDDVVCFFEDGGISSMKSRQGSVDKYKAIFRNFGLLFFIRVVLVNFLVKNFGFKL
ncbi:glycosyltransferase family 2 protein [Shewanella oncorhynchi]|uniref:glycosyltransferase family 2 protein n=1 Tax=Shewanella oncorhynchi TaxID=2726434 RepID=UPI003D7BA3A2